jgi:hypothetical protein
MSNSSEMISMTQKQDRDDTRISLYGANVEDVLREVLKVPPPDAKQEAKERARQKRRADLEAAEEEAAS